MKRVLFLLFICGAAFIPAHAAFSPAQTAAFAVEQAVQNTPKLFTLHTNSLQALPKEQFSAVASALALVQLAKPYAQAPDFTDIPQAAFPDVITVQVIFDTRANIAAQLAKSKHPQLAFKKANGLTVTQQTPDKKYIHTVFIPTDDFTTNHSTHYITARVAVVLAHEIYGHVYHYLQEPKLAFAAEAQKEKLAYEQSTAFARGIISSQMFKSFPPQLQEQFRAALAKEETLLRSYTGGK